MSDLDYVDVSHMLNSLGIENINNHGEEIIFSCPFPEHNNNDSNPSASMNKENTAWICFGCHRQGNAVSFVSDYENVSPIQAIQWLKEAYGEDKGDMSAVELLHKLREKVKPKQTIENKVIESFPIDSIIPIAWNKVSSQYQTYIGSNDFSYIFYDYMVKERGFSASTLDRFNVGVDRHTNRVAIPIYNLDNKLVGFKGRSIVDHLSPKYLMLGDRGDSTAYGFEPCKISLEVFNANNVNCGEVILCEGELDAIKLCELGYRAIAISGSNPSNAQLKILAENYTKILMFFDSDKAGKDCARKIYHSLYEDLIILNVPEHEGDPSNLGEKNHELIKNSYSPFLEFVRS